MFCNVLHKTQEILDFHFYQPKSQIYKQARVIVQIYYKLEMKDLFVKFYPCRQDTDFQQYHNTLSKFVKNF